MSWHLSQTDLGSAPRQDDFRADASLPSGWYQVKPADYSGYGFDRGHNCPSADRTATIADNSATFLLSNMMPQAPQNNQQTWGNLEDYCHKLVGQGNELYTICGSYGRGSTGSLGYQTTIAGGKITVPSNWGSHYARNGKQRQAHLTIKSELICLTKSVVRAH